MDYETITVRKEQGVATITLNRPEKMNAVNQKMLEELIKATEEVGIDDSVSVVVLTGAGRGFCAGADLDSPIFDLIYPGEIEKVILKFGEVSLNLRSMGKPAIASVNGAAVGAGFSFALACDIIIASEQARFGHAFVNVGLHSDSGATYFLPRLVGVAKACELVFTGDIIEAKEAERIGLVNKVVPGEVLHATTQELAFRLAKGPRLAISMAKKSIYQGLGMDLASAIEFEARAHTMCWLSQDKREGVKAFKEKRKPVFTGN